MHAIFTFIMIWSLINIEKSFISLFLIKDRKKTPLFKAKFNLKQTTKGYRPYKFRIVKDGKEENHPPDRLIKILRQSNRIMVAKQKISESDFINMLNGFQLKCELVSVCRFCLIKNKFNFVNKKSIKYHSEFICKECAKEELDITIKSLNFREDAIAHIYSTLMHSKDLNRVIDMLHADTLDSELTRFDMIGTKTHTSNERSEKLKSPKIKNLKISNRLKKILLKKSENLLPVQMLSIESGLLKGKSQLITSVTATGKTLIGEIAGIENILKNKGKMLFLVPLVALANQKYDQFKKRYSEIGLKTAIRVGSARIKTKKKIDRSNSINSDIIVGTYEGIDYLLRTNRADSLGAIGTIVIDEVHTIEDEERGHRLDGVISRLKYIVPDAQFIYLSATIANPTLLANKLKATLIEYEFRPVPIERHLFFCVEQDKLKIITELVLDEYGKTSSKGHKGQTIIFTNSRKNCHQLSERLPMKSAPYHGGLTDYERKKIEHDFISGKIPVVVTTAALAAGVDFPASQIIFESLAMGIEWLTMQDFLQMLGRAGRPDYHDMGKVVLLPVPNKTYSGADSDTEDTIALKLLKGKMSSSYIEYDEEAQMEEILSSVAITSSKRDLEKIHKGMVGSFNFNTIFAKLMRYKLINISKLNKDNISLTEFGSIIIRHFLPVSKAFLIRNLVSMEHNPINIVTNLEFFDGAYFKYHHQISKSLNINMPARVFHGAAIDIIFEGENITKLDLYLQEMIFRFAKNFLTCSCKDTPYCGCAERKFSEYIIDLRVNGYDPFEIISDMENQYGITAYTGDVFDYLDSVIRNLDALVGIAYIHSKKDLSNKAKILRKSIEG